MNKEEIIKIIGGKLPILKQKVDLVTKNALKRGIKDEIIKETLYV